MAKRRANKEGSITKRKDGKWLAIFKVGTQENGKPKNKYIYGNSQREVLQKLEELKISMNMGIQSEREDITVSQCCKIWLEQYKKELKPTTLVSYSRRYT